MQIRTLGHMDDFQVIEIELIERTEHHNIVRLHGCNGQWHATEVVKCWWFKAEGCPPELIYESETHRRTEITGRCDVYRSCSCHRGPCGGTDEHTFELAPGWYDKLNCWVNNPSPYL
jgi:hypothetical protein